ncbi:MAG: type II secretion system protein [Candidatus Omnitrophota bacterium]|nr:MAG: type II secretion system protein [Candidatus Omnitrophota bacterium]
MKRGFTLGELIVATLILSVVLVSILSMYVSANFSVQQARDLTIAAKDASGVFEHMKSLSLAEIKSNRGNSTYWNSVVNKTLSQESITVVNMDDTDTYWDNNPLELGVTVDWKERGRDANVTMISKFTD